ncbi:MAG TPA: hypothetical protein VLC94_08485 [Candidatus Acidoferrum sp.]|nr:hypothetical protein [Candidatus Acidoferrum sp.]
MLTATDTNTSSASRRCSHLRADGKRCADAVYPGHTALCHHHLTQQMSGIADGNSIAADILASVGNFQSASAINVALGKLLIHQLTGRISRQDALALAYTFQLLLQTLKLVKSELVECGYNQWWKSETARILSGPSDLDELTNSALLPESTGPLHPPALEPDSSSSPAPTLPSPPCSAGLQPSSSPTSPSTPPPPPTAHTAVASTAAAVSSPSSCSAGLQPSSSPTSPSIPPPATAASTNPPLNPTAIAPPASANATALNGPAKAIALNGTPSLPSSPTENRELKTEATSHRVP